MKILYIVCRVPPKAAGLQVFTKWHVAFHGTKDISVSKILETGDLLMPGNGFNENKLYTFQDHVISIIVLTYTIVNLANN